MHQHKDCCGDLNIFEYIVEKTDMSFVNGFLSASCTDFLDQIEYLRKLRRAYSTVISVESAQKDGKLFDWFPFSFYFTVFSFNIPLSPRVPLFDSGQFPPNSSKKPAFSLSFKALSGYVSAPPSWRVPYPITTHL